MLIITGHIYVAPADLTRFVTDLNALAIATRQRQGNISYNAAIDDPQAGRLILAERWADQTALSAHLDASDTAEFVNRWQGKMRGDVRKYDALNERSLMAD